MDSNNLLKLFDEESSEFHHFYWSQRERLIISLRSKFGELTRADIEDIFHNSLIELIAKLRTPVHSLILNVEGYLNRITYYKAIRYSEAKGLINNIEEFPELEYNDLEYDKTVEALESVFCLIKEECKRILKQFYFEGKKMQEIASIFNVKEDAIRKKKQRCISGLREEYFKIYEPRTS